MKKIFLILLFSISVQFVFAQSPCENEIMNRIGKWSKGSDANMKAGNNSQIISCINQISKLFQSAYKPIGAEAKWYGSMDNFPLIKDGPIPFQFRSLYLTWFCAENPHRLILGDETSTWAYVFANNLWWFADPISFFVIQKNPVFLLTKKVGNFNGYPLYEGLHSGTSNTGTIYSRTLIITRDSQSPYLPVTKKQYLKAYLNRIEKRIPKALAQEENRRIMTEQEEEDNKRKNLASIERSNPADKAAKAKDLFLRSYVTDKQRHEETLNKLKKMFEDEMKPARELLGSITEEEGEQPAIVDGDYVEGFKKFLTDEAGGRMLVRLNPDYFKTNLPTYFPQFLIVYWRWKNGETPSEYFKDQLQKNLDFNALKQMIDK